MDCVVGSGPAGVACAQALLERGRQVLLLDAGLTLEPERARLVERLRSQSPEQWSPADLAAHRGAMRADPGGVPIKLVHGSDYPYRGADDHLGVHYDNVGLRPSFALGGLSNVWGAAMMPYTAQDTADWPFPIADLAPHYAAVVRLSGLAAVHDDLAARFPLYTDEATELLPSAQARQLLESLERNRAALSREGILFGRARVAVTGASPHPGAKKSDGCVYCRLCMYGCPYGFIRTTASTVASWHSRPGFRYQPNAIVTSVREAGAEVEVSGHDLLTRAPLTWKCDHLFLAAGAIPTTRILLRSIEAYDQTAWLQDSQYFLAPFLQFRRVRGAATERLHALSQVFLEVLDPAGRDAGAHIQIYTHSDLIGEAIASAFGPLRRPLGWLARNLEERLLIAQGFLHSRHSSRIKVTLQRGTTSGGPEHLHLRGEVNVDARRRVRALLARLRRHARHLGAWPLPVMVKIAEPGRSFHAGGSFPMTHSPSGFQTDLLGRPPGWSRVHAVDATIFPSIAATTITLTVMANAHRIGSSA